MDKLSLENICNILRTTDTETDNDISIDLKCTICKNIMINPYCVPCGCRYCSECLTEYLNGEQKFCFGDFEYCKNELIDWNGNVQKDYQASLRISKLVVKCPLKCCDFKTEFSKISDHISACDKQQMSCPFISIGCSEEAVECDKIKDHFLQEDYSHFKLLMEWVNNSKNEAKLLQQEISFLKEQIVFVKLDSDSKQETIESVNQETAILKNEIKTMKEELIAIKTRMENRQETKWEQLPNEFTKKLQQMERNQIIFDARIDEISQKSNAFSKKSDQLDEALESIKTWMLHKTTNKNQPNEFVWCIRNWSEKVKDALNGKKIFSDPFYSHKSGYKMKMELTRSIFGGNYLDVLIFIMRGEFDNTLQWPFRYDVTVSLINQTTRKAYKSSTWKCKENPNRNSIQKPTDTMNDTFGMTYDFINIGDVFANPALCQEDQILLKITSNKI